jgi:hypothetical protein
MRSISLLPVADWNNLQYSWVQGLLCSCSDRICEGNEVSISIQNSVSEDEAVPLLLHLRDALPSFEEFSKLLGSQCSIDHDGNPQRLFSVAVSEAKSFAAALKGVHMLIQHAVECLSRRCYLSSEEEDIQFLMLNKTPERWRKLFALPEVMLVPEFINHVTHVAAFWSSWHANPSSIPALPAGYFMNFRALLQVLALEESVHCGCNTSDIKFVVMPVANEFCGAANIRVQGLRGRGFSWNGKFASSVSDVRFNPEGSFTESKRSHTTPEFKRITPNQLFALGEVTIAALSPRALQQQLPPSLTTTAALYSVPVLRQGFDSSEVDDAPVLTFLFNKPTNTNFLCIFR